MTLAAVLEVPRKPRRQRRLAAVPDLGFSPRIAPPLPKSSDIAEYRNIAKLIGEPLYPWQDLTAQYMTAKIGKRWLYPELVICVARQNGKTRLLMLRIVMGLVRGERIMMTAQDRQLIVRDVFTEVADVMEAHLKATMKGKPRRANGQESILMLNGGRFRIVAPTRGGARGPANDLVIVDEAREMEDHEFIAGAQPTLTVSPTPQMIYTSNAGIEKSVVLNALRKRAEVDPELGYLEWSAHPDRPLDDRTGWHEANPSLAGGKYAESHLVFLEDMYRKYTGEGTPEIFETEHLCRWVVTEMPRLVSDIAWERARAGVGEPKRPVLAIAQDPAGRRASAALAWQADGNINVLVLADVDGYPVDLEGLAKVIQPTVRKYGIRSIGFDPWSDRDFARHFKDPKPIQAADYEAACRVFVESIESGKLRYQDDDGVLTADMAHTVRRETGHSWIAVRDSDERPTTASLAVIRAVWLATKPQPSAPQVY